MSSELLDRTNIAKLVVLVKDSKGKTIKTTPFAGIDDVNDPVMNSAYSQLIRYVKVVGLEGGTPEDAVLLLKELARKSNKINSAIESEKYRYDAVEEVVKKELTLKNSALFPENLFIEAEKLRKQKDHPFEWEIIKTYEEQYDNILGEYESKKIADYNQEFLSKNPVYSKKIIDQMANKSKNPLLTRLGLLDIQAKRLKEQASGIVKIKMVTQKLRRDFREELAIRVAAARPYWEVQTLLQKQAGVPDDQIVEPMEGNTPTEIAANTTKTIVGKATKIEAKKKLEELKLKAGL